MSRRFLATFVLSVAGTGLSASALAAPVTYRFDTVHSQIHASASHLGFSDSTGRFHVKDGTLVFDPADWSSASVEAVIAAMSLDFGDAKWDQSMQAEKFFNVAKFPELRFVSTAVSGDGNKGTVSGELSLLGVSKPVTLDVTFNRRAVNPFSKKDTVGFSATAVIKRSEWGMTANIPAVGDEVSLRFEIEAAAE